MDRFDGLVTVLLIVGVLLYFVPFVVAVQRDHNQRTAIGVLNLLLGWTFVGWVVALVWALIVTPKADEKRRIVERPRELEKVEPDRKPGGRGNGQDDEPDVYVID